MGAVLGAWSRYAVAEWTAHRYTGIFPWGTFLINLVGSFILALFLTLHLEKGMFTPNLRAFVAIGWCASFTTFSTFSYETFRLVVEGQTGLAAVNVFLSVGICLAGTWAGVAAGRLL